jgi:S-adenosyl methyltransferase
VLLGVMGHITDTDEAQGIVQRLVDGLPSGSHLVLADGTNTNADFNAAQQGYDDTGAVPYQLRSAAEIARFFGGLELVEPGVVTLHQWRPELSALGPLTEVDEVCGVARTS